MNQTEIFISYAWKDREQSTEDSREQIVDEICKSFENKGYTITQDRTHLPYKGDIEQFMKKIGAGKYIIAVVSEKYLRSDYCMFEVKEMLLHDSFAERVFPIVLDDAGIFGDGKFEYGIHWNERKKWVSDKVDQIGRDSSSAECCSTNAASTILPSG